MITDINSYRHRQKLAYLNQLVKDLMAVRVDIQQLKIQECQLRNTIKEVAQDLDWPK